MESVILYKAKIGILLSWEEQVLKCIINGKLVLPGKVVEGKALLFDETITEIVDAAESLPGKYETIAHYRNNGASR